jgi:methyl-accepting chemotaxis protein
MLMPLDVPVLISLSISVVGITGLIAALIALLGVKHEHEQVVRFQQGSSGELLERVSDSDFRPASWLKEKGFKVSSHLGDQVLAVYGGWRLGRPPGLAELHNLWTRRERSRFSARVAGGIAATLLICGIAGTLSSVHPILQAFKISVDSNGAVQEASQSAYNVVSMVQGLGRAFYPSLTALAWTLVVVFFRGLYAHKASSLARDLDRLTIDYFFPSFRPSTLSEDFSELAVKLSTVADRISERDTAFAAATESLQGSIDEIGRIIPAVKKASEDAIRGSAALAKDTTNVVSAFAKHLAEGSPLFLAVDRLGRTVDTADESVKKLHDVAIKVSADQRASRETIEQIAEALKEAIENSPDVIRGAAREGAKEIANAGQLLSADVRKTADVIVERLGSLLETSRRDIEIAKTALDRSATTVSDRVRERVEGITGALERKTAGLDETTKRINRAVDRMEKTPFGRPRASVLERLRSRVEVHGKSAEGKPSLFSRVKSLLYR